MTPQPLPEGYDPADYIAVKVLRMDGKFPLVRSAFGGTFHLGASDAFALPVPAPTPPPWADVPPAGVWHATGASIIDNGLDWGYSDDDIDGKHRDATEPDRVYYAREPHRRAAATILDEIDGDITDGVATNVSLLDQLAEYRAALTAEAGQ